MVDLFAIVLVDIQEMHIPFVILIVNNQKLFQFHLINSLFNLVINCHKDNECPGNTQCIDDPNHGKHCGCQAPFVREGDYCICKFFFYYFLLTLF